LLLTQLDGALDRALEALGFRWHAEEAMSLPQDASQPHPRAV
jgi:hypothetical protein